MSWMATSPSSARFVAHQGGWDEILFVLVPIALFGSLLAMANRRASRQQDESRPSDPTEPR